MFRSYYTNIIGVSISFLKVNTLNVTLLMRNICSAVFVKMTPTLFWSYLVCVVYFTHLVLFQCYLPLFLTPNEGSNTSKNLLILLYSLNKVGWKEANPVLNFPLKGKRRHASTIVAFIVIIVTK